MRTGKPWIIQYFHEPKKRWLNLQFVDDVHDVESAIIVPSKEATRFEMETAVVLLKKIATFLPDGTFRLKNIWSKEEVPSAAL